MSSMIWLYYMIAAAITMAIHVTSVKALGMKISPVFTATIFLFVGGFTTLAIGFFKRAELNFSELYDTKIIVLCLIAGVSIGLTDFFVASSYANKAPLTLGYPIFASASAILLGIAGLLIFKEVLTLTNILGIACALLGIFLIVR